MKGEQFQQKAENMKKGRKFKLVQHRMKGIDLIAG